MTNKENLLDELFSGEKSICFFVHRRKTYWIADYKYNFSLDAEKDYRAHLDKGNITFEQYTLACKSFRGGILKLTSESFPAYIENANPLLLTHQEIEELFYINDTPNFSTLLRKVEDHYLYGSELSANDFAHANSLISRLPMFYINFDRKIYKHMDSGRFHETLAHPGWSSQYSDFGFLIPDKERYWMKNGDFWKLKFIQPHPQGL